MPAQLEKQIASRNGVEPVDSQQAPVLNFADLGLDPMELEFGYAPELLRASNSPETNVDIGETSLDWRLATPQMASSLSQHLCEGAFLLASRCYILADPPRRSLFRLLLRATASGGLLYYAEGSFPWGSFRA